MTQCFTREQLYALVWTESMQKLSAKLGISDVGLAKACRRALIPVPERGYWNKLQAGKRVVQAPLPMRPLGMRDRIEIGHESPSSQPLTQDEIVNEVLPDDLRRQKQLSSPYPMPLEAPVFDSSFERRRLRFMNTGWITLLGFTKIAESIRKDLGIYLMRV